MWGWSSRFCLFLFIHSSLPPYPLHHPVTDHRGHDNHDGHVNQSVTRSLFQFSRRERVFLSFNLMFETGTRISFSQSRASRREREFHLSISGFETRTRIEIETILARIFGIYIYCLFIDWYFQKTAVNFSKFLEIICFFSLEKFEWKSNFWRQEWKYFAVNLVFRDENKK